MNTKEQNSKMDKTKKIIDILRVMSWMDEKRWSQSTSPGDLGNDCFRSLNPPQQILVHWLCYITDRMRPFEQVWRDGGQVFSEIVAEYRKSVNTEEDVLNLFSHKRNIGFMKKPEKDEKTMDTFRSKISNIEYAVRFPDDLYSIVRTLILLLRYKKDLIYFISKNKFYLGKTFRKQRKRIAHKLKNPRIMRIHFHTLRHWKATMEYAKTKDILHVMQFLGHKNIENTLKYTQLVNFESDEYACKVAKTIKEASELIEAGFEYVTAMDGYKLFRKRK